MTEQIGRLQLDDLLSELMDRAGDVLATQDRLRDLLHAVRLLSEGLSMEAVLNRLTELAGALVGAASVTFSVDDAVTYLGERSITYGDSSAGGPTLSMDVVSRGVRFGQLRAVGRSDTSDVAFGEDEVQTVRTLCAAAAIAVHNAQSYEALRRRQAWTDASAEITDALLDISRGGGAALTLICERAVELAGAWYAVVILPAGLGRLRIEVGFGEPSASLIGVELETDHSLSGIAMRTREIVVSENPAADSRAWTLAPATSCTLLIPLVAEGSDARGVLSVTYHDGSPGPTEDEKELMMGFAAQAALALEFERAQRDRAQLAVLEDRDRIGRELHDLVIQRVFAIGMSVQSVTRLVEPAKGEQLLAIVDELDATIRDLRQAVFQTVNDLSESDLLGELRKAVADIAGPHVSMVDVDVVGDGERVPPEIRAHLLAVAREALSNAMRHSHASSITVVFVIDDAVTVVVADDGVGLSEAVDRRSGTANLDQRARALGGAFSLTNRATGGAVARWSVPLPAR